MMCSFAMLYLLWSREAHQWFATLPCHALFCTLITFAVKPKFCCRRFHSQSHQTRKINHAHILLSFCLWSCLWYHLIVSHNIKAFAHLESKSYFDRLVKTKFNFTISCFSSNIYSSRLAHFLR